jgi:hypothetical protein
MLLGFWFIEFIPGQISLVKNLLLNIALNPRTHTYIPLTLYRKGIRDNQKFLLLMAGWSSGLRSRLWNQRSRVQIPVMSVSSIIYYQFNLYTNNLWIFIRYLVPITQVLKYTLFGLDNWCECGNLLFIYLHSRHPQNDLAVRNTADVTDNHRRLITVYVRCRCYSIVAFYDIHVTK